jgi:hypothetical protein
MEQIIHVRLLRFSKKVAHMPRSTYFLPVLQQFSLMIAGRTAIVMQTTKATMQLRQKVVVARKGPGGCGAELPSSR